MKLITCALSALIVLGSEMMGDDDMHGYGMEPDMGEYEIDEDDMQGMHRETHVVELTADNFNEETKGKKVFIKFFSPWCENCTDMEPAWAELAEIYEGSATAVIGEVDCRGPGEDLCIKLNIDDDFPTLMYGDPENLKHYTGSFEYYALVAFAGVNIEAICGPANVNLCSAEDKKKIDSMLAQGIETLREKIDNVESVIHTTQSKFEDEIEKLYEDIEGKYNKLLLAKEHALDELRDKNDIGLMRTVLDHLREKFPDHIDL